MIHLTIGRHGSTYWLLCINIFEIVTLTRIAKLGIIYVKGKFWQNFGNLRSGVGQSRNHDVKGRNHGV